MAITAACRAQRRGELIESLPSAYLARPDEALCHGTSSLWPPLPRLAQSSALPSTPVEVLRVPDIRPLPTNAMTNVASCDGLQRVSLPSARLRWYAAMTAPVAAEPARRRRPDRKIRHSREQGASAHRDGRAVHVRRISSAPKSARRCIYRFRFPILFFVPPPVLVATRHNATVDQNLPRGDFLDAVRITGRGNPPSR